jgi:capsular polysaccharide biosynthesis protein
MEELELRQYWNILRKRWILVISIPVIAAIVSALLSFFVLKPQYEADTTLLVNQKAEANPSLQYDTIMANQALVSTYSNIIKSRTIEQTVIDNLNLPYTVKQLDAMITVSSPNQSQVIDVKVVDGSQAEAARIANELASVFQSKAETLMDVKNVQVVDPAEAVPNPVPVKPNKMLNIAIAFILGLMVSVGVAFLLEYLDNRLRTEEDVIRYLGLPVLGAIMDYEDVE